MLVALKIIIELHKQFRPSYSPEASGMSSQRPFILIWQSAMANACSIFSCCSLCFFLLQITKFLQFVKTIYNDLPKTMVSSYSATFFFCSNVETCLEIVFRCLLLFCYHHCCELCYCCYVEQCPGTHCNGSS